MTDTTTKLTQEHIDFLDGLDQDNNSLLDAIDGLKEKFEITFYDAGELIGQWLEAFDWRDVD